MFSPNSKDSNDEMNGISSAFTSFEDLTINTSLFSPSASSSSPDFCSPCFGEEDENLNFNIEFEASKIIELSSHRGLNVDTEWHDQTYFLMISNVFVSELKRQVKMEIQCLEQCVYDALSKHPWFSALCYQLSEIFFDGPLHITKQNDSHKPVVQDATPHLKKKLISKLSLLDMSDVVDLIRQNSMESPSKKASKKASKIINNMNAMLVDENSNDSNQVVKTPKKSMQIVKEQLSETFFEELESRVQRMISRDLIVLILEVFADKTCITLPNENDGFLIRRMDSLSRLLSLAKEYSVCSAVSVIKGTLYISANNSVSQEDDEESTYHLEIINELKQRMQHIQEFIQEVVSNYTIDGMYNFDKSNYSETYHQRLKSFYALIFQNGGTTFPEHVIYQAISKLCISLMNNHLPGELTEALLNKVDMVIMTATKVPAMVDILLAVKRFDESLSNDLNYFLLQHQLSSPRPLDFHCEQLMYFYTKMILQLDLNDVPFGISKLCCPTCYDVLNSFQDVVLRGSHQNFKDSVANIIDEGQVLEQVYPENDSSQVCGIKRDRNSACLDNDSSMKTPVKNKKSKSGTKPSPFFSPTETKIGIGEDRVENHCTTSIVRQLFGSC